MPQDGTWLRIGPVGIMARATCPAGRYWKACKGGLNTLSPLPCGACRSRAQKHGGCALEVLRRRSFDWTVGLDRGRSGAAAAGHTHARVTWRHGGWTLVSWPDRKDSREFGDAEKGSTTDQAVVWKRDGPVAVAVQSGASIAERQATTHIVADVLGVDPQRGLSRPR